MKFLPFHVSQTSSPWAHHFHHQQTYKKLFGACTSWYKPDISKPTNISLVLIRVAVSSYEGKKPKSNEGKKLGYAFWKVLTNCWLTKGEETERL